MVLFNNSFEISYLFLEMQSKQLRINLSLDGE